MDSIDELTDIFTKFPGTGPRQARRFVMYLLRQSEGFRQDFSRRVTDLSGSVSQCQTCMRFYAKKKSSSTLDCALCENDHRQRDQLLIVAQDSDVGAIEGTSLYSGLYFVLGSTTLLNTDDFKVPREEYFKKRLALYPLEELILALPASTEGDLTADTVRLLTQKLLPEVKITTLGRGLSTGSELEYADPATIKFALERRM
jgi:recombination protein RecR